MTSLNYSRADLIINIHEISTLFCFFSSSLDIFYAFQSFGIEFGGMEDFKIFAFFGKTLTSLSLFYPDT